MKVLIIPEDQELDRYVLKPVVERLFAELARPARIDVLPEPRLRGSSQALDPQTIAAIVRDNPMTDLFLLIVDRDCDRDAHVSKLAARVAEHPDKLIGCLAVEEVECWLLALSDTLPASWREIREHCDPKERYVEPFLAARGSSSPGRGRKAAMRELAGNWRRLVSRCPEIQELSTRIASWLGAREH
ncbi:hypothetical protein [Sandaracinus amylolyticus]|uniref:DUF4276 family protein n=1 Tax=Sandaracinus amylolyticus TaxID=927083 RepID=A0A0F6W162_9BACT|nr:hypothetical protein [Sandaracinus amylolyticus]AKF04652.1 hypothetical protein DB32_001801 [Sandaracinus amylolyticus]